MGKIKMKSIISIAVLALISNTEAIHHRAMHQARGQGKGNVKDINTEGIDPYVYELASPSVDEAAWSRPAQPPARTTYTPYSADTYAPKEAVAPTKSEGAGEEKAEAPEEAKTAEAPVEGTLTGLYQNGVFRPVYAMPNGSMLIQDGEEPAKAEAKAPAKEGEEAKAPAKEGDAPAKEGEAKEEKKGEGKEEKKGEGKEAKKEAEAKEGDDPSKPTVDPTKIDPFVNNVVTDGNGATMGMSDGSLERMGHAPLKWNN